MQPHWNEARRVFEALAYLVKTMVPSGIELRFTNSCEHDSREKDRKKLIKTFDKVKPSGQGQLGIALNKILPKYRQNQTNLRSSWYQRAEERPAVNIYIFTDGIWSPGHHCLSVIQEHITNLVDHLWKAGKLQHVGIQFIRFGDDEIGQQRLEYLDNDNLQHYEAPGDIVDTEPSTGNVFKMLFGSIDRTWDNDEDEPSRWRE